MTKGFQQCFLRLISSLRRLTTNKLSKAFFFRNQRRALEDLNEVQKMLYSSIRRFNNNITDLNSSGTYTCVQKYSHTFSYLQEYNMYPHIKYVDYYIFKMLLFTYFPILFSSLLHSNATSKTNKRCLQTICRNYRLLGSDLF